LIWEVFTYPEYLQHGAAFPLCRSIGKIGKKFDAFQKVFLEKENIDAETLKENYTAITSIKKEIMNEFLSLELETKQNNFNKYFERFCEQAKEIL